MRTTTLSACLVALGTLAVHAQISTYTINGANRIRVKELGGGARLLVTEYPFGFDSSHVACANVDADWNVTAGSERRFATDPLWFFFDAAAAPNGLFVTGTLTNTYKPQLHFVNNDGTLAWCTGFDGMNASQTRFSVLVGEGANVVGYSNADGMAGDATYRVETDQNGSAYTLRRISTTNNLTFRLFAATNTAVPGEHMVGGVGVTIGVGDIQALLGRFTTNGATWLKQYEMGSTGTMEEVDAVVRPASGGAACAINLSQDNPVVIGAVLRVNDAGDVQWCTKLNFSEGVLLSAITEMSNGDLLVAGSNATGLGMLFRLNTSGELLWARKCGSCFYSTINAFHRDANNTLYGLGRGTVFTFDEDGVACGFDPVTTVTATDFVPVVTTLNPTVDMSPAVTTSTMNMLERPANGSSTVACTSNAIAEQQGADPWLSAHPVPTDGPLFLDTPAGVRSTERVVVRDVNGAVVFSGTYGNTLDLAGLASGIYSLELPALQLRTRVVKR